MYHRIKDYVTERHELLMDYEEALESIECGFEQIIRVCMSVMRCEHTHSKDADNLLVADHIEDLKLIFHSMATVLACRDKETISRAREFIKEMYEK